ncbi:MAG: hypothetical protein ACR2FQ_09280 [Pseudonocardiaceae bacterium]
MPPPFVAYLRVYEPLRAFDEPGRSALARAVATRPVDAARAGQRERELWLRSQLAAPPRLLPVETADGSAARVLPEVLVLDPAHVPAGQREAGPLVCPMDLRPRAAAALLSFLDSPVTALHAAAVPLVSRAARARSESVIAELVPRAVHIVSSTWTVPLPWFTLVDPAARHIVAAPRPDPARRVCWQATMADARRRAARAYAVSRRSLGEEGPTRVLREIGRWLQHFDGRSAVELDYGGLVQLLDDEALSADTSAVDVHAAVDALEAEDAEGVARAYERLQDFWGGLAAAQRHG